MKNILWIDDEPLRFEKLKGEKDLRVFFAHGFDQVNHYLNNSNVKFDLIILDHDMPQMDGMQVCQEFLLERNIPIVLCSMNPSGRGEQKSFLTRYDDETYKYPVHDVEISRKDFKQKVIEILFV